MELDENIEKEEIKRTFTSEQLNLFDRMRNLPFEDKVEIAHKIVKEAFSKFKRLAVAFSGGKDSTVVLHIVRQYNPDIPVIFANTRVEMPETIKFIRELKEKWNLNLIEVKGKYTFWQIVEKYGLPSTRFLTNSKIALASKGLTQLQGAPKCCWYLKEEPALNMYRKKGIECVFFGITWDESYNRKWSIIKKGLLFYHTTHKHWKCYPIGYWSELDVWTYIEKNNIPVNPAYEKVDRVGCIVCTAYKDWEHDMARLYPALYKRICKILGINTIDSFIKDTANDTTDDTIVINPVKHGQLKLNDFR